MKAAILAVAISTVAVAQTINPSPRAVIKDPRPLLPAEVSAIFDAVRQAIAGKAFRVGYTPAAAGVEYVMRDDGRPEWMRTTSGADIGSGLVGSGDQQSPARAEHVDLINIVHYTRTPARSCDGSPSNGELVIEYERKTPPGTWTVRARTRGDIEIGGPIFEMLSGSKPLESGAMRDFDGGRRARAFVRVWAPPGRSLGGATSGTESLWIDVDSLLPVRWAVVPTPPPGVAVPPNFEYGMSFTYDASIDVRPPDGVIAPDCVR